MAEEADVKKELAANEFRKSPSKRKMLPCFDNTPEKKLAADEKKLLGDAVRDIEESGGSILGAENVKAKASRMASPAIWRSHWAKAKSSPVSFCNCLRNE